MHLLSNVCVLTKYSQAIEIENFAVPVLMVADLRVGLLGGTQIILWHFYEPITTATHGIYSPGDGIMNSGIALALAVRI